MDTEILCFLLNSRERNTHHTIHWHPTALSPPTICHPFNSPPCLGPMQPYTKSRCLTPLSLILLPCSEPPSKVSDHTSVGLGHIHSNSGVSWPSKVSLSYWLNLRLILVPKDRIKTFSSRHLTSFLGKTKQNQLQQCTHLNWKRINNASFALPGYIRQLSQQNHDTRSPHYSLNRVTDSQFLVAV